LFWKAGQQLSQKSKMITSSTMHMEKKSPKLYETHTRIVRQAKLVMQPRQPSQQVFRITKKYLLVLVLLSALLDPLKLLHNQQPPDD
jgi:hypothetical protein